MTAQLDWLSDKLSKAELDEKFIIMMHIFETADWWDEVYPNWAEDSNQSIFFDIILSNKDKIIFEVTGHNHLAGLRASAPTPDSSSSSEYYLNKVIFPGLTAVTSQQPGFGTFIYDTDTTKASQLKMTFVDLNASYDKPESTTYDELTWLDVDFETQFGLEDVSAASIADLATRLQDDPNLAREYEFNRMGVPLTVTDDILLNQGWNAYKS